MSAARTPPPVALPLGEPARSVVDALPSEPFGELARQRGLRRLLLAREGAPQRAARRRWVFAAGVAGLLAALGFLARLPTQSPPDTLKAAPTAQVDIDRDRVKLESGEVEGAVWRESGAEPLRVTTPHLRLSISRARWKVTVREGQTELVVLEGKVAVEQSGGLLMVEAGQRFLAPARRTQDCDPALEPRQRESCLESLAAGVGLSAEGALYSLALVRRDALGSREGALQALSEHRRRFPASAFAPEVTEAAVALLLERGDGPQALRWLGGSAAAKTDRLVLLQAQALVATERFEEADALLLSLADGAALPELREEALFLAARQAVEHGPARRARSLLLRYREQHPSGAHQRVVDQWLAR